MKKRLFLIAILISILSCSNPIEKEFNKETMFNDLNSLVKSNEIDSLGGKEVELYILARQETFTLPTKIKYKEILSDFITFKKCKDLSCLALRTKVEKVRVEMKTLELATKVTVAVVDKYYYETVSKEPYIFYQLGIGNFTKKEIKGVNGEMIVKDQFGVLLQTSEITTTELKYLKKDTYGSNWLIPYNVNNENHLKILNTKFDDLKIEFNIVKILYKDGTIEQ